MGLNGTYESSGSREDVDKAIPYQRPEGEEIVDAERYRLDKGVGSSRPSRWRSLVSRAQVKLKDSGVEDRGIIPRTEEVSFSAHGHQFGEVILIRERQEREPLSAWGYLPQFTLWAAWNTNILTFSEGMLGPSLFALDLKTSILCIVFFTAMSCIPPAYCASNGPKTGMRQMVQARYALGYWPALVCGFLNCLQFIGFMSLTVILGGQSLSLAASSSMSWTVGIIVVSILSLLLSFVGLRALHWLSLGSFPVVLILFIVIAGVTGSDLKLATSETARAVANVTVSGVLGYGSSLIGFTVSYCSLASDFTSNLPSNTSKPTLFVVVFIGFFVPIVLVQILGAVAQTAAFAIPAWDSAALVGVPDLIFTMLGEGGAARFVMVLLCFSVAANTAPTIYSCGLSAQVAIPFLVRAVFLPIAIVGANHFYSALSNFLYILAYWTAIYIPPIVLEPLFFRRPASHKTYPPEIWNDSSKLPIGYAAIASLICGVPLIAAGMSQHWWNGWIARAIPGGEGDLAWEITFPAVSLVYLGVRYLERRRTGR